MSIQTELAVVLAVAAFAVMAKAGAGAGDAAMPAGTDLLEFADVRKRIPEAFKGSEDTFQCERMRKRLEVAEHLAALPGRTLLMQAELDEFKAYFQEAFAHWANDPLNPAVKPIVLDVKDFGAVGDGRTDNIPAFDRAVAAVRALGGRPSVLKVGDGDYLFGAEGADYGKRGTNLDFTEVTNCVLMGMSPEKTRFLFGLYDADGIRYYRSSNATIANVDCRWAVRPFSQTVVESYDTNACTVVVKWHPGTLRPDDPRFARGKKSKVCGIFDADGRMSKGAGPYVFFDCRADDLGGGRFRVYLDPARPGTKELRLSPGDYLILPDRNNPYSGASGIGSEFCNFSHVWFRNARAAAIGCGWTHYSTASHCRTIPEGDGIVFSSNADTFYNARGGYLAHCEFHHMCDDGANSLGYGSPIAGREGPRTLLVRHVPGRLRDGDVVQILDAMEGRFRATLRVAHREDFRTEDGKPCLRLTFDEDLPTNLVTVADIGVISEKERYAVTHGLGTVRKVADLLYAPLQFGTGFVCFDNRIHDLRGVAISIQCPHALIESNVVENAGFGIRLTGLTQWFEGSPPYDVVIRDNVIRNCHCGVHAYFCNVNGRPVPEGIHHVELSGNRLEGNEKPYILPSLTDSTFNGRPIPPL